MSIRQLSSLSNGIRLRDILPDARTIGAPDVVVRSACGQWDECQKDDVFVAVVGADSDGHDYASEAVQRGATAVIGERLMPVSGPQFIVEDSRTAYGAVCHALAGNPSQRMSTIGVAGSDGKTVTSHLIHSVFEAAGLRTGLSSSIETRFGESARPPGATLNSPVVADQLLKMVVGDCTHAVMETSSTALAQHALAGLALDAAVLTNVRTRHLEFHGSADNYNRAKMRLVDYLKPSGFAIVNADEKNSHQILDELSVPALSFGIHRPAEVSAKILDRNRFNQTFILSAGNESVPVLTPIIGKQHVYNCLAAAAVGLAFNIDLELIARGLESAHIPGRLEVVDCGQDFGVWIDSSSSPNQLSAALDAVGRGCSGKVWCICSTDESQSPSDRKRMGAIVERKAEHPIITQSKATPQCDYEPAHQILDGFDDPAVVQIMPDRFKAIEWALSHAKADDAILVAGGGEKAIAVIGENDWRVTDRDICQAWLYDQVRSDEQSNNQEIYRFEDYQVDED